MVFLESSKHTEVLHLMSAIYVFNLDLVKNSCTLSGFKKLIHELHFSVPNNQKWSSEKRVKCLFLHFEKL